jgi:hypothetical protein
MASVDLLYVPDCPNRAVARERLNEAARRSGVEVVVSERLVADADTAAALGMHGSPTILVDGRDVASGTEPSVSCRLYRTASGLDGAPSVDELVVALSR